MANTTSVGADLLIRAGKIRTLNSGEPLQKALAVKGEIIWGLSEDAHGLDALITPTTRVLDYPDACVLPPFDDTHTHLYFAASSVFDVPVQDAKTLKQILDRISARAQESNSGTWIITAADWQEFNVKEQRLPTRAELDACSTDHPIVVRRGGHNIAINSKTLELAGVTEDTKVPPGGAMPKDNEGRLNGLLQDGALRLVNDILPVSDIATKVKGVEVASTDYASLGIGCVRDCFVPIRELRVFKAAYEAGKLKVRLRVLVAAFGVEDINALLDLMEEWRQYRGNPWFNVWGVKFLIDGGIEAAATNEPYANPEAHHCHPGEAYRGVIMGNKEDILQKMDAVVRRGWRIGTHAYGDRGVETLLDIYEQIYTQHPYLARGSLVMEHGGLARAKDRAKAVRLGIPVTIQHPLLFTTAAVQEFRWGDANVQHVFPVRQWIDDGALVSAGSDYPVGSYGAMHSVYGLITRQTVAGVRGPQYAISAEEAVALHTTEAALFLGEHDVRGRLTAGRFADFSVWSHDPLEVAAAQLEDSKVQCLVLGGRIMYTNANSPK